MTSTTNDYAALLPEAILLGAAVLVLLGGSFLPRSRQVITRWFGLGALTLSAATALAAAGPSTAVFSGTYAIDAPTTVVRITAPLATVVVVLLGRNEFVGSMRESETYALLILATLGTVIIGGSTDLLVLVAGYLLASIPLYALIGLSRSARAAEATLKTYLLGALFGVVLMGGVALLTGLAATSSYAAMAGPLQQAPSTGVAAGAVAVLIGLTFKAGAVPGHFWIPDASQASSIAVAAFLTTVPKLGALIALARLVQVLPDTVDIPLLVAVLAAISMSVGNLAALVQQNVRRLLGWSTVSQVGYLLMPVAVITGSDGAMAALLAYLAFYALTNLSLFAVVACQPRREVLGDWAGTARSHPWLTACLIVGALSLAGTPPTAVFVGKVAVFTAAWDGSMAWLVVVAAVNSVLSLVYYLRLIRPAFRPAPAGGQQLEARPPEAFRTVRGTAVVLGAGVLAAGPLGAGIWLALGT
ncbi:NADH-quinone oxidoreductase subunit N [Arthrobacter rhombi]|uniref:NADH-quinone oxidoreductase subunit N n=1 Tax=Micrococcaceae TaxID=1268 RepID=UPI000BB9389C|nr:NADH-quinone oxidoreductase subunit N [Glutamicibacter sp. BW78]PCC24647.1 hypothetical protein CIK75_10705 [Glutamicibacter sp. BW78]